MVGSAGTPRDAASEHASRVRDAITYTRRVSREASAANARHRAENAELVAEFRARRLAGHATDATPTRVKDSAKNFRVAAGLPVHDLPDATDLVPPKRRSRPQVAPKSEEDEDFSQARIMVRGD
ncbi:hypothetical protein [Amycolatopsis sp. CA-230715]|uniref:hypothetical protein n=1 Tax=Amycolatopsis sp. CA-230715 TaxID=2745196 RepID=UPI001C0178EC|nr:hypothetical protein [Amycolatopsis sp. CA-230715]QWF79625.1 hypothetical protein HUW46_03034 [Amycolatopsis sp. CA-230715]